MKKLTDKTMMMGIAGIVLVCAAVLLLVNLGKTREQMIYREDMVKRQDLAIGVTADGAVEMDLVRQQLTLDEKVVNLEAAQWSIEEVCVSEGQVVQEGEALYLLDEAVVTALREELRLRLDKAETELNAVNAEQESAKKEAKYTYDSDIAYGGYADLEYDAAIRTLEAAITTAQEHLTDAENILSTCQEQLKVVSADYTTASKVLKECENSLKKTDPTKSMNKYVEYFEMTREAQSNVDTLAEKKERLEESVAQAKQNVESYTKQLETAQRELKIGRLEAQKQQELRKLAFECAQETYDYTMDYLAESVREQEEAYADAKEKWDNFCENIEGNAVKAQFAGVAAKINLSVGDILLNQQELITLYDYSEVCMTVSIEEQAAADIEAGGEARVRFDAYPDKVYRAVITEISGENEEQDVTVSDSNGQSYRDVTITLEGDVSGLLQGMTGEITLITQEIRDVLCVSKYAVYHVDGQDYVKVVDQEGNVTEQRVTVGFTDGIDVEIVEGVSEKDVVSYALPKKAAAVTSGDVSG